MLMKYKDFKQMSIKEMKKIIGGNNLVPGEEPCYLAGTCGPNNEFKCNFDSAEQACMCGGKENFDCYAA